ncbi:MAG: bifunctional nuclease family protein [Acidimicrobiia bacterium]|nr:bifunctional nuclease family protein [Acidimicrobiia bacterium]NNL14577.1 bifunctional nuclease family protein [Acidimicrobiia bacterium]RZV41206.1 MAG: bifunctional nuclease family protein [Acidimicrobiia bacterium]
MELVGVRIELPTNQPIVLLREAGGLRYLPIWIGATEATAIAFALEGVEPQRPLTHDLLRDTIAGLGATIDRVVVNDLREGIYYADLVLAGEGGEVVISARPSDAIALAARTEASLFASEEVLNEAGVEIKEDDDEEAEVERFKEFLDTVQPEDFTGGS